MKKIRGIGLLLAAMMLAVLTFGTADASENYVVKKGDTLWKISQKAWGFGKMYKIIADENGLKNPNKIYPGQKLVIPDVEKIDVRATNRAPFGAKAVMGSEKILETIGNTDYSEVEKECLRRSVIDSDPYISEAKVGEKFDYYTDKSSNANGPYGPYNYVVAESMQGTRWHRECETTWLKIICDQFVADTCGNWVPRCIKEPKPPPEVKKPGEPSVTKTQEPGLPPAKKTMEPPKKKSEVPPTTTFPPVPVFDGPGKVSKRDKFDLYVGGGIYQEAHSNQDAKGYYAWGKTRYRPIWAYLGNNIDLGLGVFASGALGGGHDRKYHYNWWEAEGGLTEKIVGPHFDIDLDQGIGWLRNQGGVDIYRGEQKENTLLLSEHLNYYARRDAGKKLFPKLELNVETRLTYNTHQEHRWGKDKLEPKAADNRRWDITATQWIYDIKKDNMVFTPGINLGFGREYWVNNNRGKDYLQFGPAIQVSSYGEDIFQINFLNYKEQLRGSGDQWHPISGWISPDGAWSAIKASRIHPATQQDIQNRLKSNRM